MIELPKNIFFIKHLPGILIELNVEESRHCIKVLRLRKGDRVLLLNGKGSIFEAAIQIPDAKACKLEILKEEKPQKIRNYQLTIAMAPTKNIDRYEWFIEKSTEIGIDRIIPVICQHSERKEIKPERLEKILIAAMKQSGQLYLPELSQPITFKELINQPFDGDKMIAHCEAGNKKELKNSIVAGKNVLILIGPEGDFDSEEIRTAIEKGFIPVSLGESRLRTETAGIVACHTVCLVNQQ
jgi:16S rRNA (uracil1498-N3)-methyltransferase